MNGYDSQTALIACRAAQAAYSDDVRDVLEVFPSAKIYEFGSDPICGFVALDAAAKRAIVAWRGTDSIDGWLGDADVILVPGHRYALPGMVHLGWAEGLARAWSQFILAVNPQSLPGWELIVCGHSLGGALAELSAYRIYIYTELVWNTRPSTMSVYTFGKPAVGNQDASTTLTESLRHFRHVCHGDVVPDLPESLPILPYRQSGQLVALPSACKDPLDVKGHHAIENYLAALTLGASPQAQGCGHAL